MKLQVINKEREPESVAPKIKVFDSEKDLDEALPDLKDGAIVATKEDETTTAVKTISINIEADRVTSDVSSLEADLHPIGNNEYLVYGQLKVTPVQAHNACRVSLNVSSDYEWVNMVGNVIQVNIGGLVNGGGIATDNPQAFNYYINVSELQYKIDFFFQGILRRK